MTLKGKEAINFHKMGKHQGIVMTHTEKLNWGHEPPSL